MNQRLTKLQTWMKENDIEVSFLTSSENVFYLSGYYTNPHERLLALSCFSRGRAISCLSGNGSS